MTGDTRSDDRGHTVRCQEHGQMIRSDDRGHGEMSRDSDQMTK